MIAKNTKIHPINSFVLKTSCNRTAPANAANTDSNDKIIPAMEGSASFCPTICKVYPAPLDKIPAYKIGTEACKIFEISGFSNTNIGIKQKIPEVKNWIQLNLIPSTFSTK